MAIDQAGEIRKGEALDEAALSAYLKEQLFDFSGLAEIRQFPGGYSNLTYLLREKNQQAYVLRRPPFGANIKSAHDMSREFRVLSLLEEVYPRAPRPVVYCEDSEVLGAPFYLMERVKGVILSPTRSRKGLDLSPQVMQQLSEATVDNLLALHALDLQATGLGELGKPQGYVQRQVEGWIKRYEKAKTDDIPALDAMAEYIRSEMPADGEAAFIHNDYKYDNLVLNPENLGEILAVLDWEMATVGDPLMDLGTSLAYWVEANDSPALKMFNLTALPGNLSREQVLERYQQGSGRDVSNILFYFVFACYKLAGIVQQIYARYQQGHTSDPRFASLIYVVKACGDVGSRALKHERISGLY
jgi:aminoglycoside phosphotransferase (APT) family kinase protein